MSEPQAAVAIIETCGPAPSVLLMRRADRADDPWSGHWSFPGGRREAEDADLVGTALRELDEECGIAIGRDRLESALPASLARRTADHFLSVAPFVFRVESELPVTPDPREAVEAIWVPLSTLRDPVCHAFAQVTGLPSNSWFPSIDLNGVPLWGFTYRLITYWLGLNPPLAELQGAGFQEADALLTFLLAQGLALRGAWESSGSARVAEISGVIPVSQVVARVTAPATHIPRCNALEIQPDHIRIVGLAFEEYHIQSL